MNCLVSNGIVDSYKPLADIEGSYSAQFEHVSLNDILWNQRTADDDSRLLSSMRPTKKSSVVETTID